MKLRKLAMTILAGTLTIGCLAGCATKSENDAGDTSNDSNEANTEVTVVAEGTTTVSGGFNNYLLYQELSDGTAMVYQVSGGVVPDSDYSSPAWSETYKGYIVKDETQAKFAFDTYVIDLSLGFDEETIASDEQLASVNGVEQPYDFDIEDAEVNENGGYTVPFVFDMAGSATLPAEITVEPVDSEKATDADTWISDYADKIAEEIAK